MAEFIGTKIFSLEAIFGAEPVRWNLLGFEVSFELTAGVLLWPVVFIMTDIINEYYGKRGVRLLSFLAVGLIAYSFVMVFGAMQLPPAGWWIGSGIEDGVPNMQDAYTKSFGLGLWIIVGSLVAFLIGQFADVTVFHWLKRKTGEKKVWLRATGSTLISQLIDSFVVLFIAFYIGADWSLDKVLAIGIMNYIYKFLIAIILTPAIYLGHYLIDNYLGEEEASRMKAMAAGRAKRSQS